MEEASPGAQDETPYALIDEGEAGFGLVTQASSHVSIRVCARNDDAKSTY